MEQTMLSVSKPSQFYQAIKQALQALVLNWKAQDIVEDALIQSYQGAEQQAQAYAALRLPTIFIEFEWQVEHALNGQGQYGHAYHIKLYCAVPQTAADNAEPITDVELLSLDLLAQLTRLVDDNTWGIHPSQIDKPQYINTSACHFHLANNDLPNSNETNNQQTGVRVLSWRQTVYLGEQEQADDETRSGMRVAANPVNIDVTDEYRTILVTPELLTKP